MQIKNSGLTGGLNGGLYGLTNALGMVVIAQADATRFNVFSRFNAALYLSRCATFAATACHAAFVC